MSRFTVSISERGAVEYLDGIPLTKKEALIAWREFGEPEHIEE